MKTPIAIVGIAGTLRRASLTAPPCDAAKQLVSEGVMLDISKLDFEKAIKI